MKSAVEKHRAEVTKQIAELRELLCYLEKDMSERNPDGVIPWIILEGVQKAASGIIYEAGRANGAKMKDG